MMRARRLKWKALLGATLLLAGLFSFATMRGLGSLVLPWAFQPSDSRLGNALSGQRTIACDASLSVTPDASNADSPLAVQVTLTVESTGPTRKRFCFLLNQGLRVEDATVDGVEARCSRSGT
ncbi:MAG: hypothetical protein IT364_27090, partial [Candidatus Hydrogenedentes bacterium]|nr:hypothetical protein [Candidatus Hydrogenedentota bacterium]